MEIEEENPTQPNMELARWRFMLRLPEYSGNVELRTKLMEGIVAGDMAPYYIEVCNDLGWEIDNDLLENMVKANNTQLAKYDPVAEEDNCSDDDLDRKIWPKKLLYLCSIGNQTAAVQLATTMSQDKLLSLNRRLDATFVLFRVAYFHSCDVCAMRAAVDQATQLIESGSAVADWSARNKLKAYEALCSLAFRNYTKAANLFLDALPTFESTELASFEDFLRYAVIAAMIALPRRELHEHLTKPGVITQALHEKSPELHEYFKSLYECRYADFFLSLAKVEMGMKVDPVLYPHYTHYVREMRVRGYKQVLSAYRSLCLRRMAKLFGVSEEMIEREVARFAAAGRLQCKIDRVAGCVITGNYANDGKMKDKEGNFAPSVNYNRELTYQAVIKRGDNLLNRLKNLARIMDF